ncbi:MAG: Ldh family oxidoreductase [Bacillota bacterium]
MSPSTIIQAKLKKVLESYGVSSEDADITVDVLIEGTLRGYSGHGVERIFQIIEGFTQNTVNPNPSMKVVNENKSFIILDGDFGLGQPAGVKAMTLAIEKAKETGIGMVGIINVSHLGILAYYAEIASKKNLFGIVLSTTSPAVVVPGGNKSLLGTNPLCYSFPRTKQRIFTADFSTAAITRSLVLDCQEKRQNLPNNCAVNPSGYMTNNPLIGGILPLGGEIKGMLISFLIATLAGPLIGGLANNQITGTRYMGKHPTKGDLFIAIDIDQLTNLEDFCNKNENLLEEMKNSSTCFYFSGEGSSSRKEINLQKPLVISQKLDDFLGNIILD